jgi:hypothetical protein
MANTDASQYPNMMSNNSQDPTRDTRSPKAYFSELPVRAGAFAGFMGSVAIMAIIGILAVATGQDVWLSPRVIASVLLREGAATGVFPILLGTIMHLSIGAVYGAIFARIMPRMPRAFWIVVGLLYGVVIWVIAVIVLPLVIGISDISSVAYFSALIISNVTFGIFLGSAATAYGYRQAQNA